MYRVPPRECPGNSLASGPWRGPLASDWLGVSYSTSSRELRNPEQLELLLAPVLLIFLISNMDKITCLLCWWWVSHPSCRMRHPCLGESKHLPLGHLTCNCWCRLSARMCSGYWDPAVSKEKKSLPSGREEIEQQTHKRIHNMPEGQRAIKAGRETGRAGGAEAWGEGVFALPTGWSGKVSLVNGQLSTDPRT